jgi:hypothetical protein
MPGEKVNGGAIPMPAKGGTEMKTVRAGKKAVHGARCGMWYEDEVIHPETKRLYQCYTKVSETGSKYGVGGGRVTALHIRKPGGLFECVFNCYWRVMPKGDVKEIYEAVLKMYNR